MDVPRKEKSILFINTPCGTTHSLRDLPQSLPLVDLKARIELAAGYPSHTYTLLYGKTALLLDREAIFGTLHSGAVIKLVIRPELEHICRCVVSRDVEGITNNVSLNDRDDAEIEKMFFAAYLSAFKGSVVLLKEILIKAPALLLSCHTVLERSLAHVAAASDHPQALQEILLQSAKLDIAVLTPDNFSKTPKEVAKEYNAVLCERLIKNFNHHKRDGSLKLLTSGEEKQQEYSENLKNVHKKKPRAKSAIVKGTYNRTNSNASMESSGVSHGESRLSSMSKKQCSIGALTESSGYQTQENISDSNEIGATEISDVKYLKDRSSSAMKQQKTVKFMARIKSAPPNVSHKSLNGDEIIEDRRLSHNKCYQRKPFLAYREVPFEELKPQAVEYIPLDSKKFIGMDARTRERSVMSMLSWSEKSDSGITPYSSLDTSLQELRELESPINNNSNDPQEQPNVKYAWHQTKGGFIQTDDPRRLYKENMEQLHKRFTNPKTVSTKRAQSANYYCATYHIRTAQEKLYEEIPPPRPKTAGCRYRAWKPWLLQVYKEQAANRKKEKLNEEKKYQNLLAFKKWLRQKQQEEDEYSSDESGDSGDDAYYSEGETYEQWLKRKKPALEKMDKKRLEARKKAKKKHLVDRNVTIYELGSTDGTSQKIDGSHTYMHAYQKWQRRKKKYEYWKKKQDLEVEDPSKFTTREVQEMKKGLYLDGFTYNEWLGQKHREQFVQKKTVKFS